LRGNIYFERNQGNLALADFSSALSETSDSVTVIVDYGKALFSKGKVEEAEKYLLEVIQKESENPVANYYLAQISERRKRPREREKYLNKTLKKGGKSFPVAYRDLGNIYWARGQNERAKKHYEKYLKFARPRPIDADEYERRLR
jgi:tetratricopeptide (TPR) repeat protein